MIIFSTRAARPHPEPERIRAGKAALVVGVAAVTGCGGGLQVIVENLNFLFNIYLQSNCGRETE